MTCKTSFELHHNFPKLAEESGFTFNTHKPRVHIEWNKIKLIDIESLVRDRKFVIVEQHINDILDCILESEFDVRILDEGVLKIFRLAQLAVEYQQFCRHYLDRSVYVLRQEVTNLLKELDTTKKNLLEKEEEIRRVKRKNKQYTRTPIPYANENIATMLLRTLNQNHGDAFASSSQLDVAHYNKCTYCEKIFLNQLYLKSHISRRHANMVDIPQKDTEDKNMANDFGNSKVNEEIAELKLKLREMESLITITHNNHDKNMVTADTQTSNLSININPICNSEKLCKEMKDAEVLTNDDTYILNKMEEWKNEEYEKYNREINLLRNQIIDIMSKNEKQDQSKNQNDLKSMEQLQMTIKQQGEEIIALKQELHKSESTEKEKNQEIEAQMSYWIKQTEIQSIEYKALLQKLDDVATEAKEYKARADTEKKKSSKLEEIMQDRLKKQNFVVTDSPQNSLSMTKSKENNNPKEINKIKSVPRNAIPPTADKVDANSLIKLQQKAQELLNIDPISSTDISSTSDDKIPIKLQKPESIRDIDVDNSAKCDVKTNLNAIKMKEKRKSSKNFNKAGLNKTQKKAKPVPQLISKKTSNEINHIPCSPSKIIRAKITEEVNHRLTSLGVDPFKNRLPQNIFKKQRALLQSEREVKAKKFPAREKILHSIITDLDQNTSPDNIFQKEIYISPNRRNKIFNLSSVLTNVKTKALSFVKSNEPINKSEKSYKDVAKRAIALLKTPPGSAQSSPLKSEIDFTPTKVAKNRGKQKKEVSYNQSQMSTKAEAKIHEGTDTHDDSDITTADEEELTVDRSTKVNHLIKSPVRHPIGNGPDLKEICNKPISKSEIIYNSNIEEESSDEIESIDISPRKFFSQENINSPKQTKGVLKNASSTSSLNKKKVLFDMEAIQMKSVSASPSHSLTDKSGNNDQPFGSVNLGNEEWDISSIENEPPKSTTNIQITSHTSPKIAELKKTIESKLAYRSPTLSTALVGAVDMLAAPIQKGTSFGGSNTSLGSSILDETDNPSVQNNTFVVKSKVAEKDDSEIEISDLINDTVDNKRYIKSF